jgi:hypothetical protein
VTDKSGAKIELVAAIQGFGTVSGQANLER